LLSFHALRSLSSVILICAGFRYNASGRISYYAVISYFWFEISVLPASIASLTSYAS
jgi:hypothetical protein